MATGRSRKGWRVRGFVMVLGDFLMMLPLLTPVLLCLSSAKGRHTWMRRGRIGADVQLCPISCTYILTEGGKLYRWGNNATGVPERFHYTASRGIISRDISPRSTPRGWNSVPSTHLTWEMNPLCGDPLPEQHQSEQPLWRQSSFGASKGGNCSNRPHWGKGSPCGDRKWPMALWRLQIRRCYFNNGTARAGYTVFCLACLFSLEAIEGTIRTPNSVTQRPLLSISSFILFCS